MENASKALIIAGSILIAIMIISLGIYIFKQYIGLKNGMTSLLRNEIIRIYDRQEELGFCPSYMKENVKEMYENYHKLGGNGMVTKMIEKLYTLPNVKEDDEI